MTSVRRTEARLTRWWNLSRRIYLVDLLARTMQEFGRRRGNVYAAAVSYYVLFSFFPLLIFIVAAFGLVVSDQSDQVRVTESLLEILPAGVNLQSEVQTVLQEVGRTTHGIVGLLALLAATWTASNMFTALRRALNSAFGVGDERSPIAAKVLDLAGVVGVLLLIVMTMLVLVAVLFVVGLGLLLGQMVLPGSVIAVLPLTLAGRAFSLLLSYAISFTLVLLIYRVVPDRRLPIGDLWQGAALAALGFEAAKFGIGLYLSNFNRYQEIYGALGSGVAFLFFVFVVATIVIFCAVLISERYRDTHANTPPGPQPSDTKP
ncbi:MAG: YihY/virulence factor BrkB family protein [Dehalococcoidia bacterium]